MPSSAEIPRIRELEYYANLICHIMLGTPSESDRGRASLGRASVAATFREVPQAKQDMAVVTVSALTLATGGDTLSHTQVLDTRGDVQSPYKTARGGTLRLELSMVGDETVGQGAVDDKHTDDDLWGVGFVWRGRTRAFVRGDRKAGRSVSGAVKRASTRVNFSRKTFQAMCLSVDRASFVTCCVSRAWPEADSSCSLCARS